MGVVPFLLQSGQNRYPPKQPRPHADHFELATSGHQIHAPWICVHKPLVELPNHSWQRLKTLGLLLAVHEIPPKEILLPNGNQTKGDHLLGLWLKEDQLLG